MGAKRKSRNNANPNFQNVVDINIHKKPHNLKWLICNYLDIHFNITIKCILLKFRKDKSLLIKSYTNFTLA